MGKRGGNRTGIVPRKKRQKNDKNRHRPAAGAQSSATVAEATTTEESKSEGVVSSLMLQAQRIFGNSRARLVLAVACSSIVLYNVLVATSQARSATGPVAWLPLPFWNGWCVVAACLVVLLALCLCLHINQVDADRDKQDRHEKLGVGADSNVAGIEEESASAAHFSSLLATFEGMADIGTRISDQIAAQTEVVHKLTDVFEEMDQRLEEIRQQNERNTAEHEASMEAMREELDMLRDNVDDTVRPHVRRILLREAMYTLGLLVEQYVFEDHSIEYVRALTLSQLQCLYDTRQLSTEQARRWEYVVDFVGRHVSTEELLLVDSHLPKACPGPIFGYDAEKQSTHLRDLKRWARRYYSKEEHPQLHAPLQQMLEMLGQFTSLDTPCMPDRSFAAVLHPNLLRIA